MIFMLISAEYRSKINLQPFTVNGDVSTSMSEKFSTGTNNANTETLIVNK